jgi:GAF domain-containing protein
VIDTAPFFLGLFASFAGRRQDGLVRLNKDLEVQIRERDLAVERYQTLQASLERTVAERTADVELQNRYLAAAAEVAQEAVSISDDPQELLARVVTLISERFGFYHAGIFTLDDAGEWAELRAVSSQGGRRMLARKHRLRVGQEGIVGHVARSGEPRIALDVGSDGAFFDNPDLPATRSEAALPLRVRQEIIGVLDVQSVEAAAFDAEIVAVLQIMADQIAVALCNARLSRDAQESERAMQQAFGEMGLETWRSLLRTGTDLQQRYDPRGILGSGEAISDKAREALLVRGTVLGGQSTAAAAVPIRIRGDQVIGVIDARKPDGTGTWTPEELSLLQSLVSQLGVALDSAQLYEDSQQRAERERVVGEISTRMRETLSIDAVLQTAIREIAETLDIAEVEVRMQGEGTGTPKQSLMSAAEERA